VKYVFSFYMILSIILVRKRLYTLLFRIVVNTTLQPAHFSTTTILRDVKYT